MNISPMPKAGEPVLEVHDLGRRLESKWIWKGLGFTLHAGERMTLSGPTGSGKTLLLRALSGLDEVDAGMITCRGLSLGKWQLPQLRGLVGFLPQRSVFDEGTVEQNWKVPLRFHSRLFFRPDSSRMVAWINRLGLKDDFLLRKTADLSGGERQIAALLRLLQLDPEVLLLDEPTSALDAGTTGMVEDLLHEWQRIKATRAWIWVSHDSRQSLRVGDRTLTLGKTP